jgi:hypothetical protein
MKSEMLQAISWFTDSPIARNVNQENRDHLTSVRRSSRAS